MVERVFKTAVAAVLACALVGGVGCAATTSDKISKEEDDGTQVYTLVYSTNNSSTSAIYRNVEKELLNRITEASEGRIVFREYVASSLVESGEGKNAVLNDVCDVVFDSPSWYGGVFPLTTLTEMAFGFTSGEAMSHVYWDLVHELQPKEYEGLKVLCTMSSGPRCLVMNTPVCTLEDIRNQQIRSSATAALLVRAWGGVPATISSSDVYEALQNNLVDGGIFSYESMLNSGYYEICNYATNLTAAQTNVVIYMSQDKYDALPSDLRQVIDEVSREFFEEVGAGWLCDYRGEAITAMEKENPDLVFVDLDEEETQRWVEAADSTMRSYLSTLDDLGYDGEALYEWIVEKYSHYVGLYPE